MTEKKADSTKGPQFHRVVKTYLETPPKPHKLNVPKPKTRPASKGRVHKGKTRS